MLILASDTSTKSISVAVFEDGRILASYTQDLGMTHSQTHMPLIDSILKESGKTISEVELFAVTIGPGSYTGIRIGVTTTKALAYALNKDVVGVSSLEVLSYPFSDENTLVCPMLDARNKRVFAGGFYNKNLCIAEGNYRIDEFYEKVSAFIKSSDISISKIVFCGNAADLYSKEEQIKELIEKSSEGDNKIDFKFIPTDPKACDLAKISHAKYTTANQSEENEYSPYKLTTRYLSPSSAERLNKNKKG